jgi:hypothetical protein
VRAARAETPRRVGSGLTVLMGALGPTINKQLATVPPVELARQLGPLLERSVAPELQAAAAELLERIAARLRSQLTFPLEG